jgi:hypothetical protein
MKTRPSAVRGRHSGTAPFQRAALNGYDALF